MIEVNNISYLYGDGGSDGISDINMTIEEGEFVAIVGPSGSGKSTFINVLASALKPQDGCILIEGKELSAHKSEVSVMFQHCMLIPWWNLERNIRFFVQKSHKNISSECVCKISDTILKQMGIYEAKDKLPSQLSGGMQQRGALGRAFAMKSRILLLDEPFGALDVNNRRQLQDLLASLAEKKEKTVIMVTHDINEALYLADRIFFFRDGKLAGEWNVPIARPRNREMLKEDESCLELKKKLFEMFCCGA